MRRGMRAGACALLILSAGVAQAADRGFYFGASGGQARYDFETPARPPLIGAFPPILVFEPDPSLNPIGIPPVPIGGVTAVFSELPLLWLPADDEEGAGWSVAAGYRINRYLAIEASYVNVGTLSSTHTLSVPPILGGGTLNVHRELETGGPALTAFGMLPLSAGWQLYARVGILFADTDLTTSINGNSDSSSIDADSTTVGAGAQYDWGGHWSARLEFQRTLELGGDDMFGAPDVDTISLGVLYRL
jgi:opacity protein-like surface antigen